MRNESFNSSHFSIISDKYFEMDFIAADIEKDFPQELNKNKTRLISPAINNYSSRDIKYVEKKKLNNQSLQEEKHLDNFMACIYMIIAVSLFSFMNLGGKYMLVYFPEIDNITTCFFRGLITFLLAIIYIYKYELSFFSILRKDKNKTFLLILRNFIWALCNYSMFEALKYMRISSAFTLYNTSPIFTSVLSVIFLKSKFTKFDVFSLLICFISVCLITKPAFLNFLFHSDISGEDSFFGILIVLISAFFTSIGILLNKLIAQDFHFIQSTVLYAIFFMFDSLFLSFIKNFTDEKGFGILSNIGDFTYLSFFIVILIGFINFVNINFYTHSLNIGDPVIILPLTYIGIVLNMVYNSLIFGKKTDLLDILGSFMIIAVNVKRILDQRKK